MTVKNNGATRRAMLVGTALGCSLGVSPAMAQNITYNGPGPYTLTRTDTVSGGPRTVDVTVTSENIELDLTRVEVENSTNTIGAGIAANNAGPGNVTIRNGSVVATGTGTTNGIDTRTTSGATSITSTGTITSTAGTSRGINATTNNGGNITIVANNVTGATRGISTGSVDANGSAALFATSQVSITSSNVTASGAGSVNAILGQGNRVVINSGTASNSNTAGNQGTAILANAGTGGVLLNAGTTTAFGQNQAAMQVFSGGAVNVTSGTVRTTQNSDGVSIASGTDIVVRSTTITTEGTGGARGLVLGGAAGGGNLNSGPNGIVFTTATLTSGSIGTVGNGAHAIYATPNGGGALTINSGTISTTGPNANGIFVTQIGTGSIDGPVTINNTGPLQTSGATASGIRYNGGTASTGLLTVSNTGGITTTGNSSLGMFIGNANGFTINSGSITTTGTGVSTGIQAAALAGATNAIAITSGSINVQNTAGTGNGITVTASNAGATAITSGTINIAGSGSGIGVQSTGPITGNITINSGDITLSAPPSQTFRTAMNVFQTAGTTTINSTGTIQSGGAGILVQARTGQQAGAVSVTSNIINAANTAINIGTGSAVTLNAADTSSSAAGQAAILVTPSAGGIATITAGAVRTTGDNAAAVRVVGNSGAIAVTTTGQVSTAGQGSAGIAVQPLDNNSSVTGPIAITSSAIRTGGNSAVGIVVNPSSGTTTINSGTIATTGQFGSGIQVTAGAAAPITGAVSITSGAITASGANAIGIQVAPSSGPLTINSGSIAMSGGNSTGINIAPSANQALTGNLSITSRDIAMTGATGQAIFAQRTSGTTNVTSTGTITATNGGIFLFGGDAATAGAVTVSSNIIATTNSGIVVNGGSNVAITAANTATSGNGQAAISVVPTAGGAVNVQAGTLTTTGTNALGINVSTNVAGATNIGIGTAATTGSAADVRTVGAITLASGTARVAGGTATGLTAISSGGNVTLSSTDLAVSNGRGIFAQGRDNASVTSGTLTTTGNNTAMFAQTSFGQGAGTEDGTVTVNSTTLTSEAAGINAAGPRAVVVVNSGTLTSGNALGIGAFGPTSTVNSGTLISQGAGIFASFDNNGTRLGLSTVNSGSVAINGTDAATTVAVASNNQSVTINSGSIVSTGLGNRIGISAQAVGGPSAPGDILINSRDISTVGNGAYAIQALASAGAVTINSTGLITTTGTTRLAGTQPRYSAGIIAVAQNGAIAVTSNNITTAGAESDGVRVEAGAGIASYTQGTIGVAPISVTTTGLTQTAGLNAAGINILGGGGAVTVANTGTIATTGDGGTGIRIAAREGAVTIDSTTATAARGDGIFVQSGGPVTVRATTASGGGDGGSGVFVTGSTVALTVGNASSNGATVTDANGVLNRADAIYAEATTGAITATLGSATATGAGADAVRLVANGANGAVTASVTGTLSSTGGYGLFIDPPGAVIVNVAAGARITGATGGINAEGGSVAITNAGTISSTGGAALIVAGPAAIDNRGTISGTGGTAAQLSASNDVVTLRTGSVVTGAIVGGGGTDAAVLIGTGTVPVATQTVAGFTGFDSLTVQSGYWTAPAGTASTVARTIVNGGAALELQNGTAGIAGYATGTITDNGLLVVRSSAASAGSTFGTTTVTGSGNVTFTGAGTTTLNGTNTLANTGINLIDGGTVLVTGTQGGNFTTGTTGTLQVGTGGTTGVFTGSLANNGTLIVNRSTDVAFAGALTLAGLFVKEGAGRVTFGTGYAFTGTTQLNGGAIRLSAPVAATTEFDLRGTGQIDLTGLNQTIAELQGPSALASINIAGGSLTVNQATSTSFAGAIVGAGSLTKMGVGTLNLTGTNTYTGPTAVNGGRLLVNGSIVSAVTVNTGGTLGGTGALGGLTVTSGGRHAPGNSIGTQAVNGNISFTPGSIFEVEVNAGGASDRTNATGTATITGGTVQVLAEAGTYARQTNYTILTAAGGVTGRFTNATSNFAFLSPLLGYSSNAVTLTLARNDLAFGAVAAAGNQTAVANAIFARGTGDPLFNAVLFQSAAGAQASFTALGGELNAGLATELTDNGRRIRQAVLDRGAVEAEPGLGLWIQGVQSEALSDVSNSQARLTANRSGVIGGLDYVTAGGIRLGVFGGYQDDDIALRARASSAEVTTSFAGGHVAYRSGKLSVQAGGLYAWHDLDTARSLGGAAFGTVTGSFDAHSAQLFAEAGYALTDGPAVVTPFIRHAATWTRIDAFTETGGTGALSVRRDRREIGLASIGIRVDGSTPLGSNATFLPRMAVAYQRAYGDLDGVAVQRFGGTGPSFAVAGAGYGEDGITVDGGFDIAVGRFSLGAGGFGSASGRYKDYGGKASLGFRF